MTQKTKIHGNSIRWQDEDFRKMMINSFKNKKKTIPLERFLIKIEKNKCWNWTGVTDTSGYGRFYDGNKLTGAHQYSYRIHYGEIPKGLVVMHSCDNKLCVNPDHISLGTQKENLQDMYRKGRGRSKDTYHKKNEK